MAGRTRPGKRDAALLRQIRIDNEIGWGNRHR